MQGKVSKAEELLVNDLRVNLKGEDFQQPVTLNEGENILRVVARNRAQNTTTITRRVILDTIPPAITLVSPLNNSRTNQNKVLLGGKIDDLYPQSVLVNNQQVELKNGSFTKELILSAGENTFLIEARDAAGNSSKLELKLIYDPVPPQVVQVIPADNISDVPLSGQVEVYFSEELNTATLNAETVYLLTADGKKISAGMNWQKLDHSFRLTLQPSENLPDSSLITVVVSADVADLAGNKMGRPFQSKFITVDQTPPAMVEVDPLPAKTTKTKILISGKAEAKSKVRISGGMFVADGLAGEDGRFGIEVNLFPDQLNGLYIYALDSYGNESIPAQVFIYQDSSAFLITEADYQNNKITIFFSRSVNKATADEKTIFLRTAESDVPFNKFFDQQKTRLILEPLIELKDQPFLLEVTTAIEDIEKNQLSEPFVRAFNQSGQKIIVRGEVYDDASGLSLAGAVIRVISINGTQVTDNSKKTVTSAQGSFILTLQAERAVIRAEKNGYTRVDRVLQTTGGFLTDIFDYRLTPVSNQVYELTPAGGVFERVLPSALFPAENILLRLLFADGSVAQREQLKITSLSAQGLAGRLPSGWMPLLAFDFSSTADSFLKEPNLQIEGLEKLVDLKDNEKIVLACWDNDKFIWKAVALLSPSFLPSLNISPGQYVLVLADRAPWAPSLPRAGEALSGATPASIGKVSSSRLKFEPETILPSSTALASLTFDAETPFPSGTPVQVKILEKYELISARKEEFPAYTVDLLLYNSLNLKPGLFFNLSPVQQIALNEIKGGVLRTDFIRFSSSPFSGVVIDLEGGTVSGQNCELEIPANSVDNPVAVMLRLRELADTQILIPDNFYFLQAVEVGLSGDKLKNAASLAVILSDRQIAEIDPAKPILLCKRIRLEGEYYLQLIDLATLSGNKLKSGNAFLSTKNTGVREGGLYLFLQVAETAGFISGRVSQQGKGADSSLLALSSHPLLAFADRDGNYWQIAFIGTANLSAVDRFTGNQTSATVRLTRANEIIEQNLDLQPVPPLVLAVNPADQSVAVPLESIVEIIFSKPIKASSINSSSFFLSTASGKISGSYKLYPDGRRLEFRPANPFPSDTRVYVTLTRAIEDLQSVPLAQAYSFSFNTIDKTPPQTNPALIRLTIPENGMSRVTGAAGAVEPGSSVIAINESRMITSGIVALSDGSFELDIRAELTDHLIIKIIDQQGNEYSLERPFTSADGRAIVIGAEGGEFLSAQGIKVNIEEGTFTGSTVLRVEFPDDPATPPLLADGFGKISTIRLNIGTARALKPLKISIPQTGTFAPGSSFFVGREVSWFGQKRLMIVESAVFQDGRITVNSPPYP